MTPETHTLKANILIILAQLFKEKTQNKQTKEKQMPIYAWQWGKKVEPNLTKQTIKPTGALH